MPDKNELGESAKKLKLYAACLLTTPGSLTTFAIGPITVDLATTVRSARGTATALSELLLGRIGTDTVGDGFVLSGAVLALSEVVLQTTSSLGHDTSSLSE